MGLYVKNIKVIDSFKNLQGVSVLSRFEEISIGLLNKSGELIEFEGVVKDLKKWCIDHELIYIEVESNISMLRDKVSLKRSEENYGIDLQDIFQTEYKSWKDIGYSHIEAKNKAIDYYRKFTSREYYVDLSSYCNEDMKDENRFHNIHDVVAFNELIEILLNNLEKDTKVKKMFCAYVISLRLDELLNEKNAKIVKSELPGFKPEKLIVKGKGGGGWEEIAIVLGYAPNNVGVDTCRRNLRVQLKEILEDFDLDFLGGIL